MQKQYKILYLCSTLEATAPTKQLYNLVKHLDRAIFYPTILTLSNEPKNSYIEKFRKIDIKVETLSLSRIKGLFLNAKKLQDRVKLINPNIVHSSGIRSDILSSNYLSQYKRVVTIRSNPYEDYINAHGKIVGNIVIKKELEAIKNIEIPVAVSKSIANSIKKNSGIDLKVITDGIDIESFFNADKIMMRKKLNLPLEKDIFISVGNLTDAKDPLTIISAVKELRDKNILMIFLGDGELKQRCQDYAIENENILIKGYVNNVAEYLQASDFYISASLTEGMPNAVLEGLSCGLPVILSDIPSHKEILDYDLSIGKLFKVKKVQELVNAMKDIREKNYKEISQASSKIIENVLNAKNTSKQYQQCYFELMDEK